MNHVTVTTYVGRSSVFLREMEVDPKIPAAEFAEKIRAQQAFLIKLRAASPVRENLEEIRHVVGQ